MKNRLLAMTLVGMAGMGSAFAAAGEWSKEGYYGGARVIGAFDQAKNIDMTSPRVVGGLAKSDKKHNHINGAAFVGYQFGNGWRTEVEYVLASKSRFSSHWNPNGTEADGVRNISGNENRYNVKAQRFMLNAYRDYALNDNFSVYATAGLGIASVKMGGWQGNAARTFANKTDQNLAYSVGLGATWHIDTRFAVDLGYRYMDMGKIESGYNTFTTGGSGNPLGSGLGFRDEQLKMHLVSHEILLGVRVAF